MRTLIALLILCTVTAAATNIIAQPPPPAPRDQILAVLHAAETAWNAGDIPGYMDSYWRSEDLRFAGGATVTYGWQQTLDRYLAHYPDRAAMGTLVFSDMDVTLLDDVTALVFGRWRLDRADDTPHGVFTLIFKRRPEGWRIVHDHTSSG